MLRRVPLYHALLFLIAYAASVAYLKPSAWMLANVNSSVAQVTPMVQQAFHTRASNAMAPTAITAVSHVPNASVSSAGVRAASEAEQPSALPPVALPMDYSSRDNEYRTLDVVTQTDERPEYRLAAVSALRSLAAGGDPDGRIRESLRMATADGDPRVAAEANAAYQEVLTQAAR